MGGGTETDCHKMLPLPRLLSKTGSGIRGHAYAPVLINLSVSLFASLSPDGSGWEILISSTVLENIPRWRTTFLFPPLSRHASSYVFSRGKIHSTCFLPRENASSGKRREKARAFRKSRFFSSFSRIFPFASLSFLKIFDHRLSLSAQG